MASKDHQILVNQLALALEDKRNVRIMAIDMAGAFKLFAQKYHNLPEPDLYRGRRPDLVGVDNNGTIHLGEAETDMNAENLDEQLEAFANSASQVHVIVPQDIRPQMNDRISRLRLAGKLNGEVTVWYTNN